MIDPQGAVQRSPRAPMKVSKATAIHEAAHAVARIAVGATPTLVDAFPNGSGMSHGTGEQWISGATGQYATWDLLIVLLAGGLAEARASKTWSLVIFFRSAADDFAAAQRLFGQLVRQGFAGDVNAAWKRAEGETREMLRANWPAVEAVAERLSLCGRVEAEEVVAIVRAAWPGSNRRNPAPQQS